MFAPAVARALRGYTRADFLADVGAGLTVGVIALPLAIGFAIASGAAPQQGLWTGIVASVMVALLGGSRFQIAGPTGAFVPVLFSIIGVYGYGGLALATLMAGAMLVAVGVLRMGRLLKFIPYPVVAGFTSGIALIIFCGQLNEFLGLGLHMPAHVPRQVAVLVANLHLLNWHALALGLITLALLYFWPFVTRRIPSSIVAVVCATLVAVLTHWPVATIGSRFGEIPAGFPGLHFPAISLELMRNLMGPAFTIAALGAIESLLSAMVADGMTDTRHDANQELIGQGVANLLCPLVGGITATGAIARTAASIRSGARTPVAAIVHALVLLGVVLFAAPLVRQVPLAALSAILLAVAFRMGEWFNFVELWRGPRADFGVLVATFILTVVFDLTVGVGAGLIMATVLFLRQMEEVTHVRLITPESEDAATGSHSIRGKDVPPGVILYRIEGPLFFAATEKLDLALRGSGGKPRAVIFRMRNVPAMDASGLHAFRVAIDKLRHDHIEILFTAVQPQPMKVMFESGLVDHLGLDRFCADVDQALDAVKARLG
ncbi:MAG TPA: SulP family inorganic anion transporter [Chthoniobacterales bacterium]|jgi:SulP family sulfate permease|nr:SulP family inorganic anion transporter [Chthoniobacterales bacterium]